jgi:predicted ABC-type ATPase
VISGCNGARKTTASFTVLPNMLQCDEFINANEIAKGLSPLNPDKVIERRYFAGLRNLFKLYITICDY